MNLPFAATVHTYETLGSTSARAAQVVIEGEAALPVLVITNRQTSGRGRGDHAWWSDDGSLTFTIGLDPAAHGLKDRHLPCLALAAGVAVIDAIEDDLVAVARGLLGLKWPNDIESSRGGKLGGLLPEVVPTPFGARFLLGLGLNVATRLGSAPAEVRVMATTLTEIGASTTTTQVLRAILDRFGPTLARLASDDPTLAARWAELDLLRDRLVEIVRGEQVLKGTARGIDATGALLLQTSNRVINRVVSGSVRR
jgi:BirA family biotin operon repressor/biotin-[acetyl-CoA-carboxylase] ligase